MDHWMGRDKFYLPTSKGEWEFVIGKGADTFSDFFLHLFYR